MLYRVKLGSLGHATFASLSTRNYRLFFTGQLISVSGTWMQTVAQSFLVLQLTHSGTALGLTTAARFAPMFLFGPWGGLIADRLDKRRVLYVTQAAAGLLAAAFAILVGTHVINLPIVYVLATALGLVNVFDNPARQSFISELVPSAQLSNAVTLNSVVMNMSRIFGAAVGGVIAASLGLALCFGLNAVSFAAVLTTLALMSSTEFRLAPRARRQPGQLREGLRYVRTTPELALPLLMIAVIGTLAWEFQVSLPLVASDTFHGGAGTYGAMTSVMGVGAVVGGLVSASRGRVRIQGLSLAAIGWGIAITVAALAPTLTVAFVVLLFVGYGSITFNSYAKTALQLAAAPHMRGRVMALWALAWMGSTPIGGPIVGWVGEVLGARWSLLVGGVPTIVVGLVTYPMLARLDRTRAAGPPAEVAEPARVTASS
ncbi:MFS transporter [Rugosimonospora africana]|uniref:MFS transporter n=1 Tax=Rugosimonospora africana TaxID=556532 RepID=A0A8J3R0H9_9ACTN|nr:MFS transporter [Rugosimonospora africana]